MSIPMNDSSPFESFQGLSTPEDDIHFSWGNLGFGSQHGPRSDYPINSSMNHFGHPDVYAYVDQGLPDQPQFESYAVQQDTSKSPFLRVDTGTPGYPQVQISPDTSSTTSAGSIIPLTPHNIWTTDHHLQVHLQPGTPSPSVHTTFGFMSLKGQSPIHSPTSPNPLLVMGSSDEAPSPLDDDDDDEEAPRPMEHVVQWNAIREMAVIVTGTNIYIPQSIYQPYTEADRVRYIKKADLKEPIVFQTSHPDQWGIALEDALKAKMKDLHGRDDSMFVDCGPSVSIRLQWPGYRAWTKQIPTMDFKSPKGPITRSKLAKNVANCVKRFIDDKEKERMETESDRRWKVGKRFIRVEDLMLVSLHHISKGSWQPQLRLRTHLSEIQHRRTHPAAPSSA